MAKTKELKDVLSFLCALANTIAEVSEDGKLSKTEALSLLPLLYKVPSAIEGIGEIPDEIADFSQEDIEELAQFVKNELDIPQDKIEIAIEDGIDLCLRLYALAQKLRA
jgi:hypothetical protein